MDGFHVTDGDELHALLKALLEAKFHPDPQAREVQGSPFVARLCERAVEALARWHESQARNGRARETREWFRNPRGNTALKAVRNQIAQTATESIWNRWSEKERAEYVRILVSPYQANDALVSELLNEVNQDSRG